MVHFDSYMADTRESLQAQLSKLNESIRDKEIVITAETAKEAIRALEGVIDRSTIVAKQREEERSILADSGLSPATKIARLAAVTKKAGESDVRARVRVRSEHPDLAVAEMRKR